MSVESPTEKAFAPAEGADERHALAFRIALAAAAGFTLGQLLGWDFPFLPSLIAVQLLSSGPSFDLKRAFGFVLLMAIGCSVSLVISLIFADRPLNLVVVIGLLIFLEFWALCPRQGRRRDLSDHHVIRAVNGDQLARARLWARARSGGRKHPGPAADLPRQCANLRREQAPAEGPVESRTGRRQRFRRARQYRSVDEPVYFFHGNGNPDEHHRHHGHRYYHLAAVGYRRQGGSLRFDHGKYRRRPCGGPRLPAGDFAPHARLSLYRRAVFRPGFRCKDRRG